MVTAGQYLARSGRAFAADASMDLWLGDPGITAQAGLVTPCRIHLEFVPGVDVRGLERFVVGRML